MVRKGFTLVEMLVVIGIIVVLLGAAVASFGKLTKGAEKAKAQELVGQVATALANVYSGEGVWPKRYYDTAGETGGVMDNANTLILARRGTFAVSAKRDISFNLPYELLGKDRFGLVTPWATKVLERNASANEETSVTGTSKIRDHRLHFAVDTDGDGVIRGVNVGGETVNIRATAVVWCIGKSGGKQGEPWPYSVGLKKDDVYSWTIGQTKAID